LPVQKRALNPGGTLGPNRRAHIKEGPRGPSGGTPSQFWDPESHREGAAPAIYTDQGPLGDAEEKQRGKHNNDAGRHIGSRPAPF